MNRSRTWGSGQVCPSRAVLRRHPVLRGLALGLCLAASRMLPAQPAQGISPAEAPGIRFLREPGVLRFENQAIRLRIDPEMRLQVGYFDGDHLRSMTDDTLGMATYDLVVAGRTLAPPTITGTELQDIETELGKGRRLTLAGACANPQGGVIRKTLTLELYDRFPTALVSSCLYENLGARPIRVDRSYELQYALDRKRLDAAKESHDFSLFQGGGVVYKRGYFGVPISRTFREENAQGITAAQRDPVGGGIPMVDVWGREMGMGIAHLSPRPEFVKLPVETLPDGKVRMALEEAWGEDFQPIVIPPQGRFQTLRGATFVHSLDAYDSLHTYARLLDALGVKVLKKTPPTVPHSYWKTWGFETHFKVADILARLPELKELGIAMVLLDDGWFSNYGDWEPSPEPGKFPGGEADFIRLVQRLHREGFKVGVWWCPQIAEPGTEVAKAHPEWMMQGADGRPYLLQDAPRSYLLCPTLPEVQAHWRRLIDKLYRRWDIDYVYHDWANLIEAPPCFHPGHRHASPLDSFREFPQQFRRIYEQIQAIKPGSGVEMCECGRPHDPFKMPFYNVVNASDPESIPQILDKLKVEKALNGPECYFAAGYVQPRPLFDYDPGTLRLTLGTGSHFQTYYTDLGSSRAEWLKLARLYHELKLYQGTYLNLYDAVYDVPKVVVVRKDARLYYYLPGPWSGTLELRGLEAGVYDIVDYVEGATLGQVQGPTGHLKVSCVQDLLLKAVPKGAALR